MDLAQKGHIANVQVGRRRCSILTVDCANWLSHSALKSGVP